MNAKIYVEHLNECKLRLLPNKIKPRKRGFIFYNSYIRKFPTKQILSMFGYEPIEAERLEFNASSDAPTVSFGKDN